MDAEIRMRVADSSLVMVLNCGSSSLKFQVIGFPQQAVLAAGQVERIGQDVPAYFSCKDGQGSPVFAQDVTAQDHTAAVMCVTDALTKGDNPLIPAKDAIAAVGHRVVHGGETFNSSVIITEEVIACIEECATLAPLHNPANLEGIRASQKVLPDIPHVAVFDTAFHQSLPPHAFHYAIPYDYYTRDHIRRYGFHGTSHKYVTKAYAACVNRPVNDVNVITCHIGNGSSVTAVRQGMSIDTSMGFTPLQGVIMGTRSGDIDPAVIFYLMHHYHMSAEDVNTLLNKKSGVLGFTDISSDMRDIEAAVENGHERAQKVYDMYAYSIAKYIGAYSATLPHTDAIIFTAGIGENSGMMRQRVCDFLPGLHLTLDQQKNAERGKALCVSAADSAVAIWAIPTNEEGEIASETYTLITENTPLP